MANLKQSVPELHHPSRLRTLDQQERLGEINTALVAFLKMHYA